METFIYKEDNQRYYYELIEFKTDCSDKGLMENVSWAKTGAGRISTSFNEFKELMEERGYRIEFVKNIGRNSPIPRTFNPKTQVVVGATGNY